MNKCGICGLEHERAEFAAETICTDALLEQASIARQSVAELTARLETTERETHKLRGQLAEVLARAESESSRADELDRNLKAARAALGSDDIPFEDLYLRPMQDMKMNLVAAEARAAEYQRLYHEQATVAVTQHARAAELSREIEYMKNDIIDVVIEKRNAAQAQAQAAQLADLFREWINVPLNGTNTSDWIEEFTSRVDAALSAAPADTARKLLDEFCRVGRHSECMAPDCSCECHATARAEYVKALEAEHESAMDYYNDSSDENYEKWQEALLVVEGWPEAGDERVKK